MRDLTIIVAQYLIILSVIASLVLLIKLGAKDRKVFIQRLLIGGIIALIIAFVARKIYYDPRPFVEGDFIPFFHHINDNGFVSDHTLLASFLAFSCFFYDKWVGLALLVLSFDIGLARVTAGVHHWADIYAAIGIGFVSALMARLVAKQFKFDNKK